MCKHMNVYHKQVHGRPGKFSFSAWNITNSFLVLLCHLFLPNADKENSLEKQQ